MRLSFHNHSKYSFDSNAKMEDMLNRAVELNFRHFGFTEHQDFDSSLDEYLYLDYSSYSAEFEKNREKFSDKIELYKGVEVDFQSRYINDILEYINTNSFDYKIGSVHYLYKKAVDLPSIKECKKGIDQIYRDYLDEIINMLETIEVDIVGHLDLFKLYLLKQYKQLDIKDYKDRLVKIFDLMKKSDTILEFNVSGFRKGLKEAYPSIDILNLYYNNGNRLITWGEDAHIPEHLGLSFDKVEILKSVGFQSFTIPNSHRTQIDL